MNPYEVVPGHASLRENGREPGEKKLEFAVNLWGRESGCGVGADASGEVKRVAEKYGVAEGQVGTACGQVDGPAIFLSVLGRCHGVKRLE